jgi:MYXO-CTERM domain-containing protein
VCQTPCRDDVPCATGFICADGTCIPDPALSATTDTEPPEEKGCSCAGGETRGDLAWWALLTCGLAIFVRRRRAAPEGSAQC